MKAISLWQPWASLWCSPRKVHETRNWATSYRGPIAVHAAKRIEKDIDSYPLTDILLAEFGFGWSTDLPCGAIIGVVDLIDCVPTDGMAIWSEEDYHCGDFAPGRYAWKRGNYRVLPHPIPCVGRQRIFSVPEVKL